MNSVDDSTTPYIVVGTTIAFEYDNDRQPIGQLQRQSINNIE